jgi:2-C-methyl-D-erythritol 4-phosphate cytidylyltransferase/2-C-methyl-D-erythritol 2,4-cyclodiphosphate synthase
MSTAAIIVAAGRGTRMGGDAPKQYQTLAGRAVLDLTLSALATHPAVAHVVAVLHPDDKALFAARVAPLREALLHVATGGASRDASVRAGLAALPAEVTTILIHDAARPLVTPSVIDRVLGALAPGVGAAPALAVTDALWRGADGLVTGTTDRAGLYRAQTPQGFVRADIAAAHAAWAAHGGTEPAADDVAVARAHGLDVRIVEGDEDNIKITLPGDLARAEAILARRRTAE